EDAKWRHRQVRSRYLEVEQPRQIGQGRHPEQDVKEEASRVLGQDDLPVTQRRRHQHFKRPTGSLLREGTHSQERRNEEKDEPETLIAEHEPQRILNALRPGGGQLLDRQIEQVARDGEKNDKDNVSDRRGKVSGQLAADEAAGLEQAGN